MSTVADLLRLGREQLRLARIDHPGREATRILGHLLGVGEAAVLARDRDPVPPEHDDRFRDLLARRSRGEPLAYLTGAREFFGRPFRVDDRVLIPRPETEHLVEACLALPLAASARALDIGTGSGCIAVTLACERPDWVVLATDLSAAAVWVAGDNARRLGVGSRVRPVVADLAEPFDLSGFDLVVANIPYVEDGTVAHLSRDVRDYEPRLALVGGPDGLDVLRRLLSQLRGLRPGSWVALEFGFAQEDAVLELVEASGAFVEPALHRDLSGIVRDVVFRRRP